MNSTLSRLATIAYILASALLLQNSAEAADVCISRHIGTDKPARSSLLEGGIGGSGLMPQSDGIGGTGSVAMSGGIGGTGIVGTITGFGSVCVNGLEVEYTPSTSVEINGHQTTTNELLIGQVVVIESHDTPQGLAAETITVSDSVAGPVSAISNDGLLIQILGQTVLVTPRTIQHATGQTVPAVRIGDFLKVSGLHLANGNIIASRIEHLDTVEESRITGRIAGMANDAIEVGDLKITAPASLRGELKQGQEVTVTGRMENGAFLPKNIESGPINRILAHTRHLSWEGYIEGQVSSNQLLINGLTVNISERTSIMGKDLSETAPGTLIHVEGWLDASHQLQAERITVKTYRSIRVVKPEHFFGPPRHVRPIFRHYD